MVESNSTHTLDSGHLTWLGRIHDAGTWLCEVDNRHGEHVATLTEGSESERAALADLIRWGYAEWAGFMAGDLACKLTEMGRQAIKIPGPEEIDHEGVVSEG